MKSRRRRRKGGGGGEEENTGIKGGAESGTWRAPPNSSFLPMSSKMQNRTMNHTLHLHTPHPTTHHIDTHSHTHTHTLAIPLLVMRTFLAARSRCTYPWELTNNIPSQTSLKGEGGRGGGGGGIRKQSYLIVYDP